MKHFTATGRAHVRYRDHAGAAGVEETTMQSSTRSDSRPASIFSALVCAFAIGMVFAGLAAARSLDAAACRSAAGAAAAAAAE